MYFHQKLQTKSKYFYDCSFESYGCRFKNAHLSRLFRPEFVRDYSKPLCSDAFSGFIKGTPRESEHNKEIEEASQYLASILIPKVAKDLTRIMQEARDQGNLTKFRLTETVHSYGINCRHLGTLVLNILFYSISNSYSQATFECI